MLNKGQTHWGGKSFENFQLAKFATEEHFYLKPKAKHEWVKDILGFAVIIGFLALGLLIAQN